MEMESPKDTLHVYYDVNRMTRVRRGTGGYVVDIWAPALDGTNRYCWREDSMHITHSEAVDAAIELASR